jgi:hypothetical protein
VRAKAKSRKKEKRKNGERSVSLIRLLATHISRENKGIFDIELKGPTSGALAAKQCCVSVRQVCQSEL